MRAARVEDPAHYRWTSYWSNALGQASSLLTPHPLYQALGTDDKARQSAYRALFRAQLDKEAVDDLRLALNHNQPLGNARFYTKIEKMTGPRREARPKAERINGWRWRCRGRARGIGAVRLEAENYSSLTPLTR